MSITEILKLPRMVEIKNDQVTLTNQFCQLVLQSNEEKESLYIHDKYDRKNKIYYYDYGYVNNFL